MDYHMIYRQDYIYNVNLPNLKINPMYILNIITPKHLNKASGAHISHLHIRVPKYINNSAYPSNTHNDFLPEPPTLIISHSNVYNLRLFSSDNLFFYVQNLIY